MALHVYFHITLKALVSMEFLLWYQFIIKSIQNECLEQRQQIHGCTMLISFSFHNEVPCQLVGITMRALTHLVYQSWYVVLQSLHFVFHEMNDIHVCLGVILFPYWSVSLLVILPIGSPSNVHESIKILFNFTLL